MLKSNMVKKISFVIPAFNEEKTIFPLCQQISTQVKKYPHQIIIIDDGSKDETWSEIKKCSQKFKNIVGIRLKRNRGKAFALNLGFKKANADLIITMDADLQDKPDQIPLFIKKINEGFDLVSGWKIKRKDPFHKIFPSLVFNFIIKQIFKIPLHDINCGFKAYQSQVLKNLNLQGEQHRFIPILAQSQGFSVTEIPIDHAPRKYGHSKYGLSRLFKGFLDLLAILINTRFSARPGHFFGILGIFSGFAGALILFYMFLLWLTGHRPIGDRPLLLLGMLMFIVSIQLISIGVLAEMINNKFKPPNFNSEISQIITS
jgi:glycosyltransferase involved in cell wall biosynthesis